VTKAYRGAAPDFDVREPPLPRDLSPEVERRWDRLEERLRSFLGLNP
jgi:hypothetical protein